MALALGTRDDANNTDPREITIVRATEFILTSDYLGGCETSKQILEHYHPARRPSHIETLEVDGQVITACVGFDPVTNQPRGDPVDPTSPPSLNQ